MHLVALRTEKYMEGDGLMYVKALVNVKIVMDMVDIGATNSFIGMKFVEELGLKLESSSNQIKMANAEVQKIGVTLNVGLTLGDWKYNFKLHIIALDDFDCILGLDFFRMTSSTIILRYGGIMIMDEACPYSVKVVPMQIDKGKKKMKKLGAIQILVGDMICVLVFGFAVECIILRQRKFGWIFRRLLCFMLNAKSFSSLPFLNYLCRFARTFEHVEIDWEAVVDRAPEELLSTQDIPDVSNISLKDKETLIIKRRGGGTFAYKKKGLYSDQQFDDPANDISEDEVGTDDSQDTEIRNLSFANLCILVLQLCFLSTLVRMLNREDFVFHELNGVQDSRRANCCSAFTRLQALVLTWST
ncbi:hypothetical protein AgCh_030558 [Apium graveolens]